MKKTSNQKSNSSDENDLFLKMRLAMSRCDSDTMYHCLRVGSFAKKVMEYYQSKYGLDVEYTPQILQWAATLHDIGKSKVPLKIIMKPDKLLPDELTLMKKHAFFGEQIFQEMFSGENRILVRCAHDVILYHHERYDGKGYPNGLVGEEIPISAQLVGLADCYDALISARSYKPSFTKEKACSMIIKGECGKFSEKVLSCLDAIN